MKTCCPSLCDTVGCLNDATTPFQVATIGMLVVNVDLCERCLNQYLLNGSTDHTLLCAGGCKTRFCFSNCAEQHGHLKPYYALENIYDGTYDTPVCYECWRDNRNNIRGEFN